MQERPVHSIPGLTRRRFVLGVGASGLTAALGDSPARAGQAPLAHGVPLLEGDKFDLTLSPVPVNITGRRRTGTLINGTMPGPVLRFREGDDVTINVTNRLDEPSSIHWHGLYLPTGMDGVPGLSFAGIGPGETFTYRFRIKQNGTYWYHSHSGGQELTGMYGALMLAPRNKEPYAYDRDYVIHLADWSDDEMMTIASNLKQQSDYYNYQRRTLGTFFNDARKTGLGTAIQDRIMWGQMRMSPTDILDIGGAAFTYLVNGRPPAGNWTGFFNPGERVRLRFINSAAMTLFDVRIPGLKMTVVAADGSDVEPVRVDEFRIGVAETYDVIVELQDSAYTIFAQAIDRSGFARATLAPRAGMTAEVPRMDPRPMRTMKDMGMGHDAHGAPGAVDHSAHLAAAPPPPAADHSAHLGAGGAAASAPLAGSAAINATGVDPLTLKGQAYVDNVAALPLDRLGEPGIGLENNGRRVLLYTDLEALNPAPDEDRPPTRDIEFHLTGNMERFVWGFDGKKFSEAPPVRVKLGERVRFVLVNNTMMEHPIHLHGFLFSLENGLKSNLPLKHTVLVKPGERLSFVFTADEPGHWAFHCHLLLHMDMGMFRTVLVA
jgi:CopA family copper-resistance protein